MPPAIGNKSKSRVSKTTAKAKRPSAAAIRAARSTEDNLQISDVQESSEGEYQTAEENSEIQRMFQQMKANVNLIKCIWALIIG